MKENLMVPPRIYKPEHIKASLDRIRDVGQTPRMVMFDPLVSFWDAGPKGDHGMNSAEGVESTLNSLGDMARSETEDWSLSFLHHLNKQGEVFGSVFLKNRARAVFLAKIDKAGVDGEEENLLELTLVKANDVEHPKTWYFDFDQHGAIWPR